MKTSLNHSMKTPVRYAAILASCLAAFTPPAFAQISIPSDGSDGALNITSNTVIDLSQAVTGVWSNNNSANAGNGIYDPEKWAVVFKYSSVNIASGRTVTFTNHPSRAPVVWLVNGDVTINGNLSLNGKDYAGGALLAEPGPGGFYGGSPSVLGLPVGPGFGPGGSSSSFGFYGSGASYGNAEILPLIGGSGGSGYSGNGSGGGGGGGAILIASTGTIAIQGFCQAHGGYVNAYPGSAGAVRLIANQVIGNGSIQAHYYTPGRIRIEANFLSDSLSMNPMTAALPGPNPVRIWPDSEAPTVRLVSVAGQAAPLDPRAGIASRIDLVLTTTNATLLFETSNFPTNGTVNIFVKPRHGNQSTYQASLVSGTSALATWQLQTNLPLNLSVIQARAVAP